MITRRDRTLPTNHQKLIIAWLLHNGNWHSISTAIGNKKTLLWHDSENHPQIYWPSRARPEVQLLDHSKEGRREEPMERAYENWEKVETEDMHGIVA